MSEGERGYGGPRGEEWSSLVGVRNGGIVANRAVLPTGVRGGMVFPRSEHSVDDMLVAWLASSWLACGSYGFLPLFPSLPLSSALFRSSIRLPFLPVAFFLPFSPSIHAAYTRATGKK